MTEGSLHSLKILGLRSSLGSFNLPVIRFYWMSSPISLWDRARSNNIWNSDLGLRWGRGRADTSDVSNSVSNSLWTPGLKITRGYFRKESKKKEPPKPNYPPFIKWQKYLWSDVCICISEDGESEVSRGSLFLSLDLTQEKETKCSLPQEQELSWESQEQPRILLTMPAVFSWILWVKRQKSYWY